MRMNAKKAKRFFWASAALLLTLSIPTSMRPAEAASEWDGGSATVAWLAEYDPDSGEPQTLTIRTASDLAGLAALVKGRLGDPLPFDDVTVKLAADIDLKGHLWEPIGDYADGFAFNGTFDGNGHAIEGLNVDRTLKSQPEILDSARNFYVGFFGYLGPNGEIRDLAVSGTVMADNQQEVAGAAAIAAVRTGVGGIAGFSEGLIDGCTFSGRLVLLDRSNNAICSVMGGIAGVNGTRNAVRRGGIRNCRVSNVEFAGAGAGENLPAVVGGIAGRNHGGIEDCSAGGDWTALSVLGGIAGDNCGPILRSRFAGTLTLRPASPAITSVGKYIGGIAGCFDMQYNAPTQTADRPAPLVNTAVFSECASEAEITVMGDSGVSFGNVYAGGIAGVGYQYSYSVSSQIENVEARFENCAVSGDISISAPRTGNVYAGGLSGYAFGSPRGFAVRNCSVWIGISRSDAETASTHYLGGLMGWYGAYGNSGTYASNSAGRYKTTIRDCVVEGGGIEVKGASTVYAGGLVGNLTHIYLDIMNNVASADIAVESTGENYAGGLLGYCREYNSGAYTGLKINQQHLARRNILR
jgi:hypothetical protein